MAFTLFSRTRTAPEPEYTPEPQPEFLTATPRTYSTGTEFTILRRPKR